MGHETSPPIPGYEHETLAELVPAAGSLLSDTAEVDALGLPESLRGAPGVVVYLIDGLGSQILDEYGSIAPNLMRLRDEDSSRSIRTCIPSTTATSITSIGTGLAPGEHGLVGYTAFLAELDTVVNLIHFTKYGSTSEGPIDDRVVPEKLQPHATVFESLISQGCEVFNVAPAHFDNTPLTRAGLRGPAFVGWKAPEEAVEIIPGLLGGGDRRLVYTYYADVDFFGHIHGVGHPEFLARLEHVDSLVGSLVEGLPKGTVLLVTGDHGMINIEESAKIDIDDEPALEDGVRALSGEPRFRHVHTERGAEDSVLGAWRDRFGSAAWVASREEAIRAGWFGPVVEGRVASMIGNVVVAFDDPIGVFAPAVDPLQTRLAGHHGSFTEAESIVPLLIHQA